MEDLILGLIFLFTSGALTWYATAPLREASRVIEVDPAIEPGCIGTGDETDGERG